MARQVAAAAGAGTVGGGEDDGPGGALGRSSGSGSAGWAWWAGWWARSSARWWFLLPLVVYAASRLLTLVAVYLVRFLGDRPDTSFGFLLGANWDSAWYGDIARFGYPEDIPAGVGNPAQSRHGFFPLFPLAVRAADVVLPGGHRVAGVAVNMAAGAVAAVLVWRLVDSLWGRGVADRVLYLFCFFPGSYALSYAYSEGLFLLCSAATLLLLHRRRWWLAALAAGVGSASRPVGWVLALCCGFAVLMELRRARARAGSFDWRLLRLLAVPVVAAGGFLAFAAFQWRRVGNPLAWQDVQERGWGQRTDVGQTTVRRIWDVVTKQPEDLNLIVPALSAVVLVVLLVVFLRARPPGTFIVFVVASVVPGLISVTVALTPRHLFAAFPLLVGPARRWGTHANATLVAVSAGLLALLVLLTTGTAALAP